MVDVFLTGLGRQTRETETEWAGLQGEHGLGTSAFRGVRESSENSVPPFNR